VFSDITPAIEIKDKEMDLEMGEQVRAIPSSN
jgi:hypothetical protein